MDKRQVLAMVTTTIEEADASLPRPVAIVAPDGTAALVPFPVDFPAFVVKHSGASCTVFGYEVRAKGVAIMLTGDVFAAEEGKPFNAGVGGFLRTLLGESAEALTEGRSPHGTVVISGYRNGRMCPLSGDDVRMIVIAMASEGVTFHVLP